jgi:hypothetical protein
MEDARFREIHQMNGLIMFKEIGRSRANGEDNANTALMIHLFGFEMHCRRTQQDGIG